MHLNQQDIDFEGDESSSSAEANDIKEALLDVGVKNVNELIDLVKTKISEVTRDHREQRELINSIMMIP